MNYKINGIGKIFLLVCLLICGCREEIVMHDTDTELQQLVNRYNLPSLSAGILKNDEIVWSWFSGYANKESGISADENTIYHLGSISKLFVAIAVMQIEEQGKLDLDADISTYLPVILRHPEFADTPITTRMLLTHTAGLEMPGSYDSQNGMWNPFDPDQGPSPSEWVPEYLITSGSHFDPNLWKLSEPGEHEFYSNIGTCVAAYIVEQLSTQNFREYCKENIFDPLGMDNTSYSYQDLNPDNIAVMYDIYNHGNPFFDNRVYAAGGTKSTIGDLFNFALCIMNKGKYNGSQILSESSVDKMLEIQNQASGKCLIWNSYLDEWFGHTGGLELGTSTTFLIHPGSKKSIIIFTNSHSGLVSPGGDIYGLVKQHANDY